MTILPFGFIIKKKSQTMVQTILFIASMIVTAVISFHLAHRLFMWTDSIKPPIDYAYPVYACIIALIVMSYVVWQTSVYSTPIWSLLSAIILPAYAVNGIATWNDERKKFTDVD